jgi:hypothetical protein
MYSLIYLLPFLQSLLIAKIANNKAIHLVIKYLFKTALEETDILGAMNGCQ